MTQYLYSSWRISSLNIPYFPFTNLWTWGKAHRRSGVSFMTVRQEGRRRRGRASHGSHRHLDKVWGTSKRPSSAFKLAAALPSADKALLCEERKPPAPPKGRGRELRRGLCGRQVRPRRREEEEREVIWGKESLPSIHQAMQAWGRPLLTGA